jgi:transketolase
MEVKSENLEQLAVNTIRMLAVDGVQKANSGHPGMPMGMADCVFTLWTRFLRYNPADPNWPDRDRFILSAGHGSMLLYAMLHLSGYEVTIEDLRQFRQWESRTPGHPEYGCLPGVETSTGPLGQGFANGVGMALASRMAAARFNRDGIELIGHRIFAVVSDGDLMEGISSEAASLAGHLGLGNMVYLYDDNHITIEGGTDLAFSENVAARFEAFGWHTVKTDGHDREAVAGAIAAAVAETGRPSLILARTHIGFGSPNKHDTSEVHGAPLGAEEVSATRKNLGWESNGPFFVPDAVRGLFEERARALRPEYDAWQARLKEWQTKYPDLAGLWKSMRDRRVPADLEETLASALNGKTAATRIHGYRVIQKAAAAMPGWVGGSADLTPSTKTGIDGAASISAGRFEGRNIHFGIREHAMGGILNGMALYGGFIPYGSTFLVFSDYMRPSVRLAAIMGLQVVYLFTHDSIFVGEDGPTHQPIEHVAALRSIPGLTVFRPADGLETAMAYAYALRKQDGPTAICLTRQNVPELTALRPPETAASIQKGGYVLVKEKSARPDVILIGTGSEVSVAVEAGNRLAEEGLNVRVVSMPSLSVFGKQLPAYRDSVLPGDGTPVAVVEAGIAMGWHEVTSGPMLFVGMNRFGASAPSEVLAEKFGFNGPSMAQKVSDWLKDLKRRPVR